MHMHDQHTALAEWFFWLLTSGFILGVAYYCLRLYNNAKLLQINGFWEWDNELWHMICLLGMAAMVCPRPVFGPAALWQFVFAIGAAWYAIRALTWGRHLPHNKQWYDWSHCGMQLGMWCMFAGLLDSPWLIVLNAAFWVWFSGYYVWATHRDLAGKNGWTLGQDVAHLAMGLVMLLMVLWPQTFMPAHSTHSMGSAMQTGSMLSVPSRPDLLQGKVVVLVFGGCASCSQELANVRALEKEFPELRFEVVNKDVQEQLCRELCVATCPTLFLLRDGMVVEQSSSNSTIDELRAKLRKFAE